jgi:uncharacterized protein
MISRSSETLIKRLAKGYPIIVITGPRQSGKTTLAKLTFPHKTYISLEDPDTREFALTDPRGFLGQFVAGAILDEIQRAPELVSYLQGIVDSKKIMGHFILTGSQQFDLRSQISQSLAGRVGNIELLPFSYDELPPKIVKNLSCEEYLWKGTYPPIYDREVRPNDWLSDYLTTYIEKDIRQLLLIKNLTTFRNFIGLVAGRVGQTVNYSSLGADAGISQHTVKEWLSLLETSYIIKLVYPYYKNFSKRLVKSPKIYFLDSGLLCFILNIRNAKDLLIHPLKGGVFETYVFSEILKTILNRKDSTKIYFWRDHRGEEIDFLLEHSSNKIHLYECKSGKTISQSFFHQLDKLSTIIGKDLTKTFLVYGGDESQQRTNHQVLSWMNVGKNV